MTQLPALSLRKRLGFGVPLPPAPVATPSALRVKIHVAPSLDRPSRRLTARYSRSYTEDLDVATPVDAVARESRRRVRFNLPPSGGSAKLSSEAEPCGRGDQASWTRTTASRVHATGRYRRGTLPPTSYSTPPGAAGPAAPVPPADLLRAARDGDEDALKKYLEGGGVDGISEEVVNAADSSGRTAVSYVVSTGSLSILESLFQVPGLDVNRPDNEGNTPLHFAAQAGQVETLNFILSRCSGVEVDARNALGFTPLMKAALQGRTKCAKLLLFAGASPTLRDCGRGLRAEQWARYCGRHVCAEVIEKFSRHRLLERTTSNGRWGSEPELLPSAQPPHSSGLRSKIKRAFRTNSSGESTSKHRFSLVSQLTSAALCASSPVLPTSTAHSTVRSLMRPLAVPKVQVTPAAPVLGSPDHSGSSETKRPPTGKSSPRQILFKKK